MENKKPSTPIGSAVIGHLGVDKNLYEATSLNKLEPILLNLERNDIFYVNGIKYIPIKRESDKEKPKNIFPDKLNLIDNYDFVLRPYDKSIYDLKDNKPKRSLSGKINIVKEYGLIQLKKSKLSKWERDKVVKVFEENFCKYDK